MFSNYLRAAKTFAKQVLAPPAKPISPEVTAEKEPDDVAKFKSRYLEFLDAPNRVCTMDDQHLLRTAFVKSHGESTDWAWETQRNRFHDRIPTSQQPLRSTFFPKLDAEMITIAVERIRTDGFYVLPWLMPPEWIQVIHAKTNEFPVKSVSDSSDVQFQHKLTPKSATYWHSQDPLSSVRELRDFVSDPALYEIASQYLGCTPVVDLLAAWWTFPVGADADSASAQLYHFDLDRARWLKVFVYLTDVDETNGPHAFIRGSHRTVGKKIWRDGRYSNEEVFSVYDPNEEVVFRGPRGTVIIEDTIGFHKGIPASAHHRFIFEYQLSANRFGYPYPALPWKFRPNE